MLEPPVAPNAAPPPRPGFARSAAAVLATATTMLLAGACGPGQAPRRPDLLLISLDTLRDDRLDAMREDGSPEMPELARFAAESVRFTNCWAPMAFTLPAHMTMMTGLHPETHGVTIERSALSPDLPTLAERLRAVGYRTFGLHTSSWLKGSFGFDRGFDLYEELPAALTFADRVIPRALELIRPSDPEATPGFFFVHFFDAHSDFSSGGNTLSYFSEPATRDDLDLRRGDLCDALGRCATDFLLAADREGRAVAPETVAVHLELYRRSARDLDRRIGSFLDELRRAGFLDRAWVVLTADHGEEFREHGKFLHSQVYRESLQVPLLIRPPGGRSGPATDDRFAGLEDLAPTLLAIAGSEAPQGMAGIDLLDPARPPEPEVRVGQDKLRRGRYSLRSRDRLLVWSFEDASSRLFDTAVDPGETRDLALERTAEASELRRRLFAELRRLRAPRVGLREAPGAEFGPREREVLRSLGYL